MNLEDLGLDYKTVQKQALEAANRIKRRKLEEWGLVRHPRRVVKIFKKIRAKQLYSTIVNGVSVYKDGYNTAYVKDIEEVQELTTKEQLKHRFEGKWIKFAFVNSKDVEWYIYDPNSNKLNAEKDRNEQIQKFGAFGFVPVSKEEVDDNENRLDLIRSGKGWTITVLKDDLLSCSFGYDYDQASMTISISIQNEKGINRGRFSSGDLVKVYMWYDSVKDDEYSAAVRAWEKNENIEFEDDLFKKVKAPHYELKKKPEEKSIPDIFKVELMFTGIVDDVEYDYAKESGNKMELRGRSLGSVLNAARIYKSYPLPGRLVMEHEEVIADIIKQQTGLPIAHLSLDGKIDWAVGGLIPSEKLGSGAVISLNELMNTQSGGVSSGAASLNDVRREDLEQQSNNMYINEVEDGIKAHDIEKVGKINIEGLMEINEKGLTELTNFLGTMSSDQPKLSGSPFKVNKNVTTLEMDNWGTTTPIWVYSDGKTGKSFHGGYPNTDIKVIFENQRKLNRSLPVELPAKGPSINGGKGVDYWVQYGIRVPPAEKREDGKTYEAVRLFFYDGWNATKYLIQERAITTSAERSSKLRAILSLNDPKMPWGEAQDKLGVVEIKKGVKTKISGYEQGKIIIYQIPSQGNMIVKDSSGKETPTGHFDVIQFMVDLNVLTAVPDGNGGYDKDHSEVIINTGSNGGDSEDKSSKTTKKKQKNGEIKLIEEALNPQCITYQDALLRAKLFYEKVRQLTRAFHDKENGKSVRACYPNMDSVQAPYSRTKEGEFAIEFPVAYPGQKIVLPPDIINAPRKWTVLLNFRLNSNGQYVAKLKSDIVGLVDVPKEDKNKTGEEAFKVIFPNGSDATDEIDPRGIKNVKKPSDTIDLFDKFSFIYKDGAVPPNPSKTEVSFVVIEGATLLKQLKQESKDLVFEGETVFEAVKKITDKYFDIIQYVDEYGFYNVRPRGSERLIYQRDRFTLYAGSDVYPKYIQGKVSENTSQTINRVVLMSVTPGNTKLVVAIAEDKVSVREHGVKQEFVKVNSIEDLLEGIKQAKARLLTHRQKLKKIEIVCEPMFSLRPGHTVDIYDIASGLSGSYLVEKIGINYTKNGGCTQTFEGYSVGDMYQTQDLEGRAAYYTKGEGDSDVMHMKEQFTESELQKRQSDYQKSSSE